MTAISVNDARANSIEYSGKSDQYLFLTLNYFYRESDLDLRRALCANSFNINK